MPVSFSHSLQGVSWDELSHLYKVAPLGDKRPDDLRTVFTNSLHVCFAFDGSRLVGAGRVLADGVDCAYVCDLAVHPSHQGRGPGGGVGSRLLQDLVDRSRGHRKIILYSVPGKEGFYRRVGFKRMATAMAIFDDQDRARENGYLLDD